MSPALAMLLGGIGGAVFFNAVYVGAFLLWDRRRHGRS